MQPQPQSPLDPLAQTARDSYLRRHDVYTQLNDIVNRLIEERPEDPLDYLSKGLLQWSTRIRDDQSHTKNNNNNSNNNTTEAEDERSAPTPAPTHQDVALAPNTTVASSSRAEPGMEDHQPRSAPAIVVDQDMFQICVDAASSDDEAADDEAKGAAQAGKYFRPGDALVDFPDAFALLQGVLQRSLAQDLDASSGHQDANGTEVLSFLSLGSDHAHQPHYSGGLLSVGDVVAPGGLSGVLKSSSSNRSRPLPQAKATGIIDLIANATVSPVPPMPIPEPPAYIDTTLDICKPQICSLVAFDVILGTRDDLEASPSILLAHDFRLALQLSHMFLTVAAYPETQWEGLVAHTLYAMQSGGMVFESGIMRKIKFALIRRVLDTFQERAKKDAATAATSGSTGISSSVQSPLMPDAPSGQRAESFHPLNPFSSTAPSSSSPIPYELPPLHHIDAVLRAAITRLADYVIDLNLATCGEETFAVTKRLPQHRRRPSHKLAITTAAEPVDTFITQELVSEHLAGSIAQRLGHVMTAELCELMRHIASLPTEGDSAEEWEASLSHIVSIFLDLGLADTPHVAAVAAVVFKMCGTYVASFTSATQSPRSSVTSMASTASREGGGLVDPELHADAAYFVASFTASVRGQLEKRWLQATEGGVIQFTLQCASIAEILLTVDYALLGKLFPMHRVASQDILQSAVCALMDLANGNITINRTFYALASAGVFTSEVPKFFYALISSISERPPPELFTLWLCGLGQHLRGGLRVVFNVKQVVDDDAAIAINQQQALQDVLLHKAITGMMQMAGPGSSTPVGLSAHALAGLQASSFIDVLSPLDRGVLTTEDRMDLLGPHGWDYLRLGLSCDDSAMWGQYVLEKARRIVHAKLIRSDYCAMASCVLRMAAAVEQSIMAAGDASGGGAGAPSTSGLRRLPLVLRALVCCGDIAMSLTHSILGADVPARCVPQLRAAWAAEYSPTTAPNGNQVASTRLVASIQSYLGVFRVGAPDQDTIRCERLAATLHLFAANEEDTRSVIDSYASQLAQCGIWLGNIHAFHEHIANTIKTFTRQFRFYFYQLSCAIRCRCDSALAATSVKVVRDIESGMFGQYRRLYGCVEHDIRHGLSASIDNLHARGVLSTSAQKSMQSTINRAVSWFQSPEQICAVDNAGFIASISEVAIGDAQHGITSRHQFAMATEVIKILHAASNEALKRGGVATNPLNAPQNALWAVATLGRIIETLSDISLPPLSGMSAVLGRMNGVNAAAMSMSLSHSRSARPASDEASASVMINGSRKSPNISALNGGTTGPRPVAGGATGETLQESLWSHEVSSAVLQQLPRDSQCLRGWYAQQTPSALSTLAANLNFEDILRVSPSEFHQAMQLNCHQQMLHGMTHHFIEAMLDALEGKSTTEAQRQTYSLFRKATGVCMTFPTLEDRSVVPGNAAPPGSETEASQIAMLLDAAECRGIFSVGFPFAAVATLLMPTTAKRGYETIAATTDDPMDSNPTLGGSGYFIGEVKCSVVAVVFRGLQTLVHNILNMQSLEERADVKNCLRLITLLTCGGSPRGFSFVRCFGELMEATHSLTSSSAGLDLDDTGKWARIMFKISEFVESRVLLTLSSTPVVPAALHTSLRDVDKFIDPSVWNVLVVSSETALAGDGSALMHTLRDASASSGDENNRVLHNSYILDVAGGFLDAATAWGDDYAWSEALTALEEVCEGLQSTEILWAAALLMCSAKHRDDDALGGLDLDGVIFGIAHASLVAYDNANRRLLLDLTSKRKVMQTALQHLDQLCDGGRCLLHLGHDVLRADIVFDRLSKIMLAELTRVVTTSGSSIGQRINFVKPRFEVVSRGDSDEQQQLHAEGTTGGAVPLTEEALQDFAHHYVLPLSAYTLELAPQASMESLSLAGVAPVDLIGLMAWMRSLLPADAPLPLTSRKSFHRSGGSVTSRPGDDAAPPSRELSDIRSALPVLLLVLRMLIVGVRDLYSTAVATPEPEEQEALLQRLVSIQSIIHLNFQKNESTAKVSLLADWQVPYIPAVLCIADGRLPKAKTFVPKAKDAPPELRVPLPILHHVLLDVYHPSSMTFARSALGTMKLSAASSGPLQSSEATLVQQLLLTIVRSIAAQRASSLRDVLCLPKQRLVAAEELWSSLVKSVPANRTMVGNLLSTRAGLPAQNIEQALDLLDRVFSKCADICSQLTAGAALLAYTAHILVDEERFLIQFLCTQWGPFVHTLLSALKQLGCSDSDLTLFAQWLLSMRMLARIAHSLRKSGVQELQFKALPHQLVADITHTGPVFHRRTSSRTSLNASSVSSSASTSAGSPTILDSSSGGPHRSPSTAAIVSTTDALLHSIQELCAAQGSTGGDAASTPAGGTSASKGAPTLSQWFTESVRNTYTTKQYVSSALLLSEDVLEPNPLKAVTLLTTRSVSGTSWRKATPQANLVHWELDPAQVRASEVIRWVLAMALMLLRNGEVRQQQLLLAPCGPAQPNRTTKMVLPRHAHRKTMDPNLIDRCVKRMVQASLDASVRRNETQHRARTKLVTALASLIMDYITTLAEVCDGSIVDAFSKHELTLRYLLRVELASHSSRSSSVGSVDAAASSRTSATVSLCFDDLVEQCVALHTALKANLVNIFLDDSQLDVALAAFCRSGKSYFDQEGGAQSPPTPSRNPSISPSSTTPSSPAFSATSTVANGEAAFPAAELQLFSFGWVSLITELVELHNLTLLKLRRSVKEKVGGAGGTGHGFPTTNEALQSALLGAIHLLHKVASAINRDRSDEEDGEYARDKPQRLHFCKALVGQAVRDWAKGVRTSAAAAAAAAHNNTEAPDGASVSTASPSTSATAGGVAALLTRPLFASMTQSLLEALLQCSSSMEETVREMFDSEVMRGAWQRALWYIFDEAFDVLHNTEDDPSPPSQSLTEDSSTIVDETTAQSYVGLQAAAGGNTTSPPSSAAPRAPTTDRPDSLPSRAASGAMPHATPKSAPLAAAAAPAAPPPTAAPVNIITKGEVSKHTSRKDCWVIVHGKVYDVSRLMLSHPGGMGVLISAAGTDATESFDASHEVDSAARTKIHQYYIGDLKV